MNWLKKGPELKLSELKVPDFLYDLFYDLKERHLLPLVALLVVAMVAAPIYFKDSSKSEPEAAVTPGATATGSAVDAGGETLVVARSTPGLRDYKRRLKHYRALDPFAGRGGEGGGTEEAGTNAEVTNGSETSAPVAATPEATETTVVGGETSEAAPIEYPSYESSGVSTESSAGSTTGKTKTRYASDTIDVRIVTVPHESTEQKKAKKSKPQAQVRRNLPELTMLPARQIPAATYLGLTNDGKKALFVVSSDVVSLFGEGQCVIGSQTCQLLALEPGLPETFVYGTQERSYRIQVLKIDRSYSAEPRRAALGVTEGKHGAKGGEKGEGGGGGGEEPAERG
ncbi:MAG: hypothetical protein BGO11_11475 [Solirubrobacterales bacterium 70-9]|nr:MAG: hypothetical protein BGO11_11475 [Solirubrobacterales bacterium 70-9]